MYQLTFAMIINLLAYGRELNINGKENLLFNGDKAYYAGGGWWRFHYYGSKGMSEIKARIKFLKDKPNLDGSQEEFDMAVGACATFQANGTCENCMADPCYADTRYRPEV